MCLDVEGLSVVYSLMYSLEYLERGLISGDVKFEDYTTECNSLLNSSKLLKQPKHYFQQFANDFGLNFQLAINRINIGSPDNHTSQQDVGIFDLSGNFITLIDALKLGISNSNQLYVMLCEMLRSIELSDKCFSGPDFWPRFKLEKLTFWEQKLLTQEELTSEQTTQFLSDMESTYYIYRQHLTQH
ncbi:VPS28 family protein [Theileria parva strain Muguga]|uniref:Vacuolar protein sorting-associated protein 28 homolog n=1 Tax=Theileria parva TaxID=5875 RepID=Q4N7X9_THEPA|nr:VPS28 family protein [Theileria parva strain Muguga]EAN33929.1 VPS28 family protein [Theileria parva strain Muguga]|eukprot:XP_766212.1 hypothetical protein [Theileria parva strain Muguga]